jgi:hypothetical protein
MRLAFVVLFLSFESFAAAPCQSLTRIGDVEVFQLGDVLVFESGLMIDADGAPNAYHPAGQGLDALANAGKPGNWWGVVTDDGTAKGTPVVQQAGDPFPGFYVSATSLEDPTYARTDPRRYVWSTKVPYVVLPPQLLKHARLGDFAMVEGGGKRVFALVADTGPKDKLGEGSIALADALGIPSSPRAGGAKAGLRYVVFGKSGNRRPRPMEELEREGQRLLDAAGAGALQRCVGK